MPRRDADVSAATRRRAAADRRADRLQRRVRAARRALRLPRHPAPARPPRCSRGSARAARRWSSCGGRSRSPRCCWSPLVVLLSSAIADADPTLLALATTVGVLAAARPVPRPDPLAVPRPVPRPRRRRARREPGPPRGRRRRLPVLQPLPRRRRRRAPRLPAHRRLDDRSPASRSRRPPPSPGWLGVARHRRSAPS